MTPRVVILTTFFRPVVGGVESNAERFARYLHAAGVPVRVVTKRVSRDLPSIDDLDGVLVERIGPAGGRTGAGKWALTPYAAWWLVGRRASYDVVCCIDHRGIGLAAIAARRVTNRGVVLQAQTPGAFSPIFADQVLERRGVNPAGSLGRAIKRAVFGTYATADAVACISHDLEREALEAGIPRARVHFMPNAIDMTRFRPPSADEREEGRARLGVGPTMTVCLFVGRLSREKGLMDLMHAWRTLRDDERQPLANAILLVAGPDMEGHPWNVGPEAREFARRERLDATTRFLGPSSDVASLLRGVDLVLQPSHFEAQGLSPVEALASGVPVIASAVGGLLDFVKDGINGRLCPPESPDALARAIGDLLLDTAQLKAFADRARASVLDDYDEQRVFSRFADLLRAVAEARS